MPNLGSLIRLLKYAPSILGIVKQLRAQSPASAVSDEVENTRHELNDFTRTFTQRMENLEQENTRLRSRIKDADASITLLKAMVWTGATFALAAFVLALLALVRVSFLH